MVVFAAPFSQVSGTPVAVSGEPTQSVIGGSGISNNHGRIVKTVFHPTNEQWFVQIAVDVHFGYNTPAPDADAEFASTVGRIAKGDGALRVQIDALRLGYESGIPVVDDCRPIAGQPRNRQNGASPCAPLNSGDASQVIGSMGCVRLRCTDPSIAGRGFFSVRWADGTLTRFSERTSYVAHDLNGCNADLAVDKIATEGTENKTTYTVPDDEFVYQIDVTNFGPDRPSVTLVDTLPAGLAAPTNIDAGPGGSCTYNASTRRLTCQFTTLGTGVRIVTFVTSTLAGASGPLTNTATVSHAGTDPNLANNSDSYTLTPAP
jgi:uncharacterized repeat protein (TIGR01451 family)